MTIRSTPLRFGALVLAAGVISLSGSAAWAFSMENLRVGGDGNSSYSDQSTQSQHFSGTQPFGPNGPLLQLGAGASPMAHPYAPPRGFSSPPPMPYTNGNND